MFANTRFADSFDIMPDACATALRATLSSQFSLRSFHGFPLMDDVMDALSAVVADGLACYAPWACDGAHSIERSSAFRSSRTFQFPHSVCSGRRTAQLSALCTVSCLSGTSRLTVGPVAHTPRRHQHQHQLFRRLSIDSVTGCCRPTYSIHLCKKFQYMASSEAPLFLTLASWGFM